ncbi:MAG: type IV pilus twitching motility protein PilT [Elusimicrobia bacterium]|nr:type IV pilus twitching motility protein PilT [Elusimicrobiota bacterium]
MLDIIKLLGIMRDKRASDVHIRTNDKPYLRIDGRIHPVEGASEYGADDIKAAVVSIMNEEQKKNFYSKHECDLAMTIEDLGRFRLNIYQQRGGVNVAVRFIPVNVPTVEELNLPAVLKKIAENNNGLVLVTGPTGSGKSSTLAAMIDHINSTVSCHIITVEDPIEFIHVNKKAIVSQREIGIDTLNYADALRNIVRQDPDVILIGEMRDLETVRAAITAAQMGHMVLSTLHTIDAIQTISRIVDLFPPHQQGQVRMQLADTLQGVVCQRLLPMASGSGQIPAVEILLGTPVVRKYIENNNLNEISGIIKQGQYYGMQTFNQALIKLYKEGRVKIEDALEASTSKEELMMTVRGVESSTESAVKLERF